MKPSPSTDSGAVSALFVVVAVTVGLLLTGPGVLIGVVCAELLRQYKLKWTWLVPVALLAPLPLLAAGPVTQATAVATELRAFADGHAHLDAFTAAVGLLSIAAAPYAGIWWALRRQRLDLLHGGQAERHAAAAVGPLASYSRRRRRRTQLAAGVATNDGILLGVDTDSEAVRLPAPTAHTMIVGGSNTGKTNTAEVMLEGLVSTGFGVVIADGKGGRDLPRTVIELARRYQRPVALWSLMPYGDPELDKHRLNWNVTGDGNPTEIKDRIATAEEQSEPYYKAVAARGILAACQAVQNQNQPVQLDTLARLLENPTELIAALDDQNAGDIALSAAAWIEGLTDHERSGLRGMGLRLQTMISSDGGQWLLPHSEGREISLYHAMRDGWLVVFTLPQGSYPNLIPHVTRYVISTVNAVCSRLEREGTPARTVFFVDELSAFDGEQLSATLERARSAGVRCMLATQSLSNFDSAGGPKLLHGALDNSELVIIHRQLVPDAADLLASVGGTEEAWEHTAKVGDDIGYHIGFDETGDRNRRLTDRFRAHPNTIKALQQGEAIVITTRPHAVRHVHVMAGMTARHKTAADPARTT